MPDLELAVSGAEVLPFAASPTLLFKLRLTNQIAEEQIHTIMLRAQIRIEVARRPYDVAEERSLRELFGETHQWAETLRSFLWTDATTVVPRFVGGTTVELPVACTYDFEVAAAKYFHALQGGEVPLLFLFTGTVFYRGGDGDNLQVAPIPWETEARFPLPVHEWKAMMEQYFPDSAWLRVRKDVFHRLYDYRMSQGVATWEEALDSLLNQAGARTGEPT